MTLPTQNLYEQIFMKQEEPIDFLVTIYEDYLTKHNLPKYDASDLLHANHIGEIELHDSQIGWLNIYSLMGFCKRSRISKLGDQNESKRQKQT